ncbi:MAG: hypothetical protein IJQ73_17695 [Kiritimatiellae bacterium]|nr:hypothetical protein [Kiritimatiellia bacterium]
MNSRKLFICAAVTMLFNSHATALPFGTSDPWELCIFPHLVCIADFIGTGTPVSTNDAFSTIFSVDEVLWGNASETNITIKHLYPQTSLDFLPGRKYLVCAFTNNWWSREDEAYDETYYTLSHCITATNRPPDNAVFNDYRVMDSKRCAIPFTRIEYGGTNYWNAVRTFTTNLIEIAKVRGDDEMVKEKVISTIGNPAMFLGFPTFLQRQLLLYQWHFYRETLTQP